ncbi:MAG: hypothetical protein M9920_12830 [Verrucomicrobiae bacterium]|nr:hypothetical protein [Verrucomicrobiae bacterium]
MQITEATPRDHSLVTNGKQMGIENKIADNHQHLGMAAPAASDSKKATVATPPTNPHEKSTAQIPHPARINPLKKPTTMQNTLKPIPTTVAGTFTVLRFHPMFLGIARSLNL